MTGSKKCNKLSLPRQTKSLVHVLSYNYSVDSVFVYSVTVSDRDSECGLCHPVGGDV